jgi:hypothetical protein
MLPGNSARTWRMHPSAEGGVCRGTAAQPVSKTAHIMANKREPAAARVMADDLAGPRSKLPLFSWRPDPRMMRTWR